MTKKILHSENAPAAIGPYVQAIQLNNLVFTSGQLGIDMTTGLMPAEVTEQARCSLNNISAILAEAGLNTNHVIKTTVFLVDMADFAAVNEVYAEFFPEQKPARSCVAVAALPKAAKVEIECIAAQN